MIDPIEHEDFELYVGSGELPPDPDGVPPEPDVPVPPLRGLKEKVAELRKGQFVATNVPDSVKRVVAKRMDVVQYKVAKDHPDREFQVSTEWFGVIVKRTK